MDKEYRVNLYRTDLKEYKKQKRKEWYEDNQEWYLHHRRTKGKTGKTKQQEKKVLKK